MKVFQINNEKLIEHKEVSSAKSFDYEKLIQTMVEKNLDVIFPELEFVISEYQLDDLRPDTIAFNKESRSFAIIEYKNVKHGGVVDQGMAYLDLLEEKREAFILLYKKIKGHLYEIKDINWDETRVIIISPEFSPHQLRAGNRTNEPIELYRIRRYENGILGFERIEQRNDNRTKSKSRDSAIVRLSEYSEDDYLEGKHGTQIPNEYTKTLFFKLKNKILDTFLEVENKQKKKYVGFYSKKDGSAICTIEVKKTKLDLCYSTTKKGVIPVDSFVKDWTGKGHWGIGDYMSEITNETDIERALPLIQKVYDHKVK